MAHIVFVCHGNICRSPMAEFVMKDLVQKAGLADRYTIDSCGVSGEETGKDLYPAAVTKLQEKGIPFGPRYARQITKEDYEKADLVLAMEEQNVRWLKHMMGNDPAGKIHRLLSYTGCGENVTDPWYAGDFEGAYQDILKGCTALLNALTKKHILFVCHGNICRSPMAEFVMKDLVQKAGLSDRILVDSCAVSNEETGKDLYPAAVTKLQEKGIAFGPRYARQISQEDYDKADLILAMEDQNVRWLKHMMNGDPAGKIHRFLSYTKCGENVTDPWYAGDFEGAYEDILKGCTALLEMLSK